MSNHILVEIEMPTDLDRFRLPGGVDERLHDLLDRQDRGEELTPAERMEAEGLLTLPAAKAGGFLVHHGLPGVPGLTPAPQAFYFSVCPTAKLQI